MRTSTLLLIFALIFWLFDRGEYRRDIKKIEIERDAARDSLHAIKDSLSAIISKDTCVMPIKK